MERAGIGRGGRLSLVVAGTAAVAAVGTVVALQRDDGAAPARGQVISDHVPVADHRWTVTYQDAVVPGAGEVVTSVGTTSGNLVLTIDPDDDDLRTVVIHDGTDELAAYDDVRGIALSDPGGTLGAWVETKETATRFVNTVVAVDSSTGEEIGRLPVAEWDNVTAVRGREVAISDGDSSRLWAPGSSPRVLRFVPEDLVVVGFSDTRVIAAGFETVTKVYDRATGAEIASFEGLTQWDTNVAGDLLAGVTADADVLQVDLATGASTRIDTSVEAGIASFGEDDTVVVLDVDAFAEADAPLTVDICPQGGACVSVTSSRTVPLLPNDAIGQLASQSE